MASMLKKILFVSALFVCFTAQAQKLPDSQTLLSFRDHTVSQVLTSKPYSVHDFFAKGFTLDARAFAGLAFDAGGKPTGGLSLTHKFAAVDFGFFGQFVSGKAVDFGVALGYRF